MSITILLISFLICVSNTGANLDWQKIKNNEKMAEYLMYGCHVDDNFDCDAKETKECKGAFKYGMLLYGDGDECSFRKGVYENCAKNIDGALSTDEIEDQLGYDPCSYNAAQEGSEGDENGGDGGSGGGAERAKAYQCFYVYKSGVAGAIGDQSKVDELLHCMMDGFEMLESNGELRTANIDYSKGKAIGAKDKIESCSDSVGDNGDFSLNEFFQCMKEFCRDD